MKILIENESFKHQGGTETISLHTFEMLKRNGHEAFFFATDNQPYYNSNYKYIKYFPKFVYNTKEYLKNPIAYYWNFEAAQNLKKMIMEVKPDIIHFNLIISPSIIKVCRDLNISSVMTLHIPSPICPANTMQFKNKEYCKEFKCKNGNYWHCIFNKCKNNSLENSTRKAILAYLYKISNSYSYFSKIICCSNALKDICMQTNIGINKNNLVVVNNFLSNDELKTQPNYSNKNYFLYIGRLDKVKGVHYLLEAIKDLSREIEVHIVGKGSEEEKLKQYAKENNLENVKFLGFKNREEIKEEYQNCISTVLPCNWFENFPTTNMESFINGKPVIASNIGGIPEQVEHNKTGLLFEPANIEQLKKCILTYWNNPELVKEHGRNGYEKAKTKYTEERYYKELMQVYENVLKEKNEV